MSCYWKAMRQYAEFRGRAGKTEYWAFAGINVLFGIGMYLLDHILRLPDHGIDLAAFLVPSFAGKASGFFLPLYTLAVLIPFLAVTTRRLHDSRRSGWYCLLGAVPLIGQVWLIVLCTLAGDPGENIYGPAQEEHAAVLLQQDFD